MPPQLHYLIVMCLITVQLNTTKDIQYQKHITGACMYVNVLNINLVNEMDVPASSNTKGRICVPDLIM
jgi:hypothetical protein